MKTQSTFMEVDQFWRKFVETAIPPTAPQNQLVEMRKAFTTGFWMCLNEMLLKAGEQDEDLDVMALELWRQDTQRSMERICSL